jgi:hypothetical protein
MVSLSRLKAKIVLDKALPPSTSGSTVRRSVYEGIYEPEPGYPKAGANVMMAVNLGTRDIDDQRRLIVNVTSASAAISATCVIPWLYWFDNSPQAAFYHSDLWNLINVYIMLKHGLKVKDVCHSLLYCKE